MAQLRDFRILQIPLKFQTFLRIDAGATRAFPKLLTVLLRSTLLLIVLHNLSWSQNTVEEISKEQSKLENLRQSIAQTQKELNRTRDQRGTAQERIHRIRAQQVNTLELITLLQSQQTDLQKQINKAQKELEILQSQILYRKQNLKSRLTRIYRLSIRPGQNWSHPLIASNKRQLDQWIQREKSTLDFDRQLAEQLKTQQSQQVARHKALQKSSVEQAELAQLLTAQNLAQESLLDSLGSQEADLRRALKEQNQAEAALEASIQKLESRRIAFERRQKERRSQALQASQAKKLNPKSPPSYPNTTKNTIASRDGQARCVPLRGSILSQYGRAIHPTLKTETFRKGSEIQAKSGSLVRAARDGEVVMVGPLSGHGLSVIIAHEGGWLTVYGFLNPPQVKVGQEVFACDILGTIASEPQPSRLFFQLYQGREHRDPSTWLKGQ